MKKGRREKILEKMAAREIAEKTKNDMLAKIAINGWINF